MTNFWLHHALSFQQNYFPPKIMFILFNKTISLPIHLPNYFPAQIRSHSGGSQASRTAGVLRRHHPAEPGTQAHHAEDGCLLLHEHH